jgi:hypothetical protein
VLVARCCQKRDGFCQSPLISPLRCFFPQVLGDLFDGVEEIEERVFVREDSWWRRMLSFQDPSTDLASELGPVEFARALEFLGGILFFRRLRFFCCHGFSAYRSACMLARRTVQSAELLEKRFGEAQGFVPAVH